MNRNVMLALLSVWLAIPVGGCSYVVVRDANVLAAEITIGEANGIESARYLLSFAGYLSQQGLRAQCLKVAELGLVLHHRAPWHAAMQRKLAGFGPDPGPPPEVPAVETICGPAEKPPDPPVNPSSLQLGCGCSS